MTTTTAPLAITRTVGEYYAPELRDRDHTSFVVSESTLVFEDPEDLFDYLVDFKGMPFDRAEKVIGRRCQFQIEDLPGRQFALYRVHAA